MNDNKPRLYPTMPMNFGEKDCYYFLYSSCSKGEQCKFRHSVKARLSETICETFKSTGTCPNRACSQRHSTYHEEKKRSHIPCYWEEHGGCTKDFCPFQHSLKFLKAKIDIPQRKGHLNFGVKTLEEIKEEKRKRKIESVSAEHQENQFISKIAHSDSKKVDISSELSDTRLDKKCQSSEVDLEDIDKQLEELDSLLEQS